MEFYKGEKGFLNFIKDLRYNEFSNPNGLKWDSSKSKEENKDAIAKRFAATAFYCAKYLSRFDTHADVLDDLKSQNSKGTKELINYFRGEIKSGFSIALTCDFLKEFDTEFEFLPKPDVHIKDVVGALTDKTDNYYHTEKREFELIEEMKKITNNINEELKKTSEKEITVYQLDRMIWLVCSGKFFLHDSKYGKGSYINKIKELQK